MRDFYIDSENGKIYIKSALNYESSSSYTIIVQARDKSSEFFIMNTRKIGSEKEFIYCSSYKNIANQWIILRTTFLPGQC